MDELRFFESLGIVNWKEEAESRLAMDPGVPERLADNGSERVSLRGNMLQGMAKLFREEYLLIQYMIGARYIGDDFEVQCTGRAHWNPPPAEKGERGAVCTGNRQGGIQRDGCLLDGRG